MLPLMKTPLYILLLLVTAACGDGSNPADPPELLFVQNSDGATLTDSTLTLTGVSQQTGWFTDRPYRVAGQVPTEEFVLLWSEGSMANDPPNADFTCTVDGEVVNYVVELTSARLDGDELTYGARVIGDAEVVSEITCDEAHLFVDDIPWSEIAEVLGDIGVGIILVL